MTPEVKSKIKSKIRTVEEFPKPGISFKDITPLFLDPEYLENLVNVFYERYKNKGITKVCGIESRGFLLGSILANKLSAGFIPVRKGGKLPSDKKSIRYELEYGEDSIEIHSDTITQEDKVLIHDDLLATGGTMSAAIDLVKSFNPQRIDVSFIIELTELKGIDNLDIEQEKVFSFIDY